MNDQGYARIHELFRRAMELEPEEWQAFLDRECGDELAVRDQVEELLLQQGDTTVGPAIPTAAPSGQRSAPATRPATERHQAGDVFDERYRIVAMLGKGGMGEVYRAHDLVLDVPVAIKFVRSADAQLRAQMIREVRLAREVTHPAVCRVYDVGERDEQLYFTMEYVDGEDLSSLIKRIGRLPSDKVVEIAHQVCAGLAAAHAKGVIHRDLKPANIMIDGKGKVRITDFGIAVLGSEGGRKSIAGTPAYMAPEQLTGGELGPATDLYAVGLILYELITGRAAFHGSSLTDYLKLKLRSRPEALTETVQDVDPRLAQAIARAMAPACEDRPQSALEMAAALPGGDPLAMAVEAGVTPDPSLVAAVSVEHEVSRRPLWALIAGLPLLLAGVLLLADPSSHFDDLRALKPPAVLADRADRMLDDLGYDIRTDDRDWGFLDNPASADPLWSVLFWYRERTPREAPDFVRQVMEAGALEAEIEIPETISHEALLLMLDHTGRLAYLHDGPAFGSHFASTPDPEDRYDWQRILGMAGLDNARLEADVDSVLPVFSDVRAAWRGTDPERPGQQLEVEAAAFDGRPVYFAVQRVDPGSQQRWQQLQRRSRLRRVVYTPLYWTVALTGLVLGVYNVVRGRSHLRGAAVLIAVVLGLEVLARLASAGGASHPLASSKLAFAGALVETVTAALAVGLCYLGMEPFVRRRRPQSLIAWNRLFTGRVRDRDVGASLLVGTVAGTGLAMLSELDRIVMPLLGLEVTAGALSAERLNATLGLGAVFGTALDQLNLAIVGGILMLFLGVLLSYLLPKRWLAYPVFVAALAAATTTQSGAHLPASWLTLGLPNAIIILFLLYRFGLLTVVASELTVLLLAAYPITTEPGAWFAAGGYFAVAAVLTVGAFGFLCAWLDRPEPSPAFGGRPGV